MKLKNVLVALLLICSVGLSAQESSGPTELIVGTFIGKTIPLRDYATQQIEGNIGIKELRLCLTDLAIMHK